jgi:tetratricopeptide (TPR) repeat protein
LPRFLRVFGIVCLVAAQPSSAHAQLDQFVRAVRELTTAADQPEPARSNGIRSAADNMKASLAEWDRRTAALEKRVGTARDVDAYQLHVQLAVTYRARGRASDALRELDAAAALRPSSSDLQMLRALTLERMGKSEDAGRAFRAAWMLDANDPVKAYYVVDRSNGLTTEERNRARSQLVGAYRRLRTATARPSTQPFVMLDAIPDTLTRAPVVGDTATAETFALLAAAKFDDAAEALRREAREPKVADDSPAVHFSRAKEIESQNRIADAKREYAAALRGTLTGRHAVLVEMARLSQVEGNLTEAIDELRQAARFNPNDAMTHRELAGAYIGDGRTDDAFSELVTALLIDPLDAQTHTAVGQLYLDTDRNAEAITAFRRALELQPSAFEVRYALATALSRAGDATEAARQFETYEQQRRVALEQRRRDITNEVEREERARGR